MKPLAYYFKRIAPRRWLSTGSGLRAKMRLTARTLPRNGRPTAILFGFSDWKTFMVDYLPNHNVVFFGHHERIDPKAITLIREFPDPEIFVWSYKFPPALEEFCQEEGLTLTYVEDGFLRSVGLGAERTRPLSLVFDDKAMHFDRSRPSELERLLMNADFVGQPQLLEKAAHLRKSIVTNGLTKYLLPGASARIVDRGLSPWREKVLVVGQVEDDLSIRYGAKNIVSGNELVRIAREENPGAEILYRPHPESIAFPKPHYTDPADVSSICQILGPEYSIGECISAADLVYTVTSLAGFEAVLHDKEVVTLGCPFYAGWGFTQDRDPQPRRTRQLTAEQVLAVAYGVYPRYFDPVSFHSIDAWSAVKFLSGRSRLEI